MWEDPEVDGRISFKTSEHQNRLIAPIIDLEEEEEHYTIMRFVTSVDVSLLGCHTVSMGKQFLIFQGSSCLTMNMKEL
jgi:hypothetical protein